MKKGNIVGAYTSKGKINADIYICTLPLYPMVRIIENSKSNDLKNNWESWRKFKDFCYNSSYSGFGFQLHFYNEEPFFKEWCQECMGDWNIIAIETYKYLRERKNKKIKTIWSCVIVDTSIKSKKINKCVNQIKDKDVILEESLRQMSENIGRTLKPNKVTISDGLYYDKQHKYWDMKNSAYLVTPRGYLNPKGRKISNIFMIGCYNLFEIAALDSAFKAADRFKILS